MQMVLARAWSTWLSRYELQVRRIDPYLIYVYILFHIAEYAHAHVLCISFAYVCVYRFVCIMHMCVHKYVHMQMYTCT